MYPIPVSRFRIQIISEGKKRKLIIKNCKLDDAGIREYVEGTLDDPDLELDDLKGVVAPLLVDSEAASGEDEADGTKEHRREYRQPQASLVAPTAGGAKLVLHATPLILWSTCCMGKHAHRAPQNQVRLVNAPGRIVPGPKGKP